MEQLNQILVLDHKNDEYKLDHLLKRCYLNALYFGAQFSKPCKFFIKKLNYFKIALNEKNKPFQTILVCCDPELNEFDSYYNSINETLPECIKHYRIKFDRKAIELLYVHFNVTKIPTVIILDCNCIVITQLARADIQYRTCSVYDDWIRMIDN